MAAGRSPCAGRSSVPSARSDLGLPACLMHSAVGCGPGWLPSSMHLHSRTVCPPRVCPGRADYFVVRSGLLRRTEGPAAASRAAGGPAADRQHGRDGPRQQGPDGPSTAAGLPHTLAGTLTGAPPWRPASPSPSTAVASPHTVVGTLIGAFAWLPPSTEPRPEVPPQAPPAAAKAAAETAAPAVAKVAASMTVLAVQ